MSDIKKQKYKYTEADVFIFKLVSGEEIISLLHHSENLAAGKPEPVCSLENPLSFNVTNDGINATPWCQWSISRVFQFSTSHLLFAVPATEQLAKHYFKEQFPELVGAQIETETKPGLILPESCRTDEEKVRAKKARNNVRSILDAKKNKS